MINDTINPRALNNIPALKLQYKILDQLKKCPSCSKQEWKLDKEIDGVCNDCSIIITAINRFYDSCIPLSYWSLKVERDFKGDARLRKKYDEIVADIKQFYVDGRSICFAGNHGVGKTFITTSILKKACLLGFDCLYTTLSDVVSVLISAPNEDKFLTRKALNQVSILVIDEFDSRFYGQSNDAADLFARTLEGVFRTRAQNKLPTLLCTNSPNALESFNGSLKSSITSLFNGFMETFIVLGEDYRSNNKEEKKE